MQLRVVQQKHKAQNSKKAKSEFKTKTAEVDYIALEEEALKTRKYRYHRVEKKDSLKKIAERYHVRLETIRRINFLVDDEIVQGSLLRIPDID